MNMRTFIKNKIKLIFVILFVLTFSSCKEEDPIFDINQIHKTVVNVIRIYIASLSLTHNRLHTGLQKTNETQ